MGKHVKAKVSASKSAWKGDKAQKNKIDKVVMWNEPDYH